MTTLEFQDKYIWPYLYDLINNELEYFIFNKKKYKIKKIHIHEKEYSWVANIILNNNIKITFDTYLNKRDKLVRKLTIQIPNKEKIIKQDVDLKINGLNKWWEYISELENK